MQQQGLLGKRLRLIRAQRKLSLRQAAKLAGLAKETLGDLERGKRHPTDITLAKLAEIYEISLQELFDLEEEDSAREPSEAEPEEPAELPKAPASVSQQESALKAETPEEEALRGPEDLSKEELAALLAEAGARIREEAAYPVAASTISSGNAVCDVIEYRIGQSDYTMETALHDRVLVLSELGHYRTLKRNLFKDSKTVAPDQREVLAQLEDRLKEVRTKQGEILEKLWDAEPNKVVYLAKRQKIQKLEQEAEEPLAETGT